MHAAGRPPPAAIDHRLLEWIAVGAADGQLARAQQLLPAAQAVPQRVGEKDIAVAAAAAPGGPVQCLPWHRPWLSAVPHLIVGSAVDERPPRRQLHLAARHVQVLLPDLVDLILLQPHRAFWILGCGRIDLNA